MSSSLWPIPIPIIGGTGKHESGKTRFGVSICPGPQTLVYDLEQSSASYAYIGFERIDVQKVMYEKYPKGYKPVDLWLWFIDHIRSLPANKYKVIMVDPVTDLERGLTDWVNANPTHFGHTAGQYVKMSGIMWGDMKDYEKMILADICARCETFYFTAHVGVQFKNNTATDELKAKGKATLHELASLYLWFARPANDKGEKPSIPTAKVVKGRLEVGEVIDGDVVSYTVLPPVLPVATPRAIREYFKNPAGKKTELASGERHVEEKLTDDERLKLEIQRAEAERDAALYKMELAGKSVAGVPTSQTAAASPVAAKTESPVVDVTVAMAVVEMNYANCIDLATSQAELDKIAPEIATAFKAKLILQENRQRLGVKWNLRKAALAKGGNAAPATTTPAAPPTPSPTTADDSKSPPPVIPA